MYLVLSVLLLMHIESSKYFCTKSMFWVVHHTYNVNLDYSLASNRAIVRVCRIIRIKAYKTADQGRDWDLVVYEHIRIMVS